MKKKYEKPIAIVEQFLLNEGIAACENIITYSPSTCKDMGFIPDTEVSPFSLERDYVPFQDIEHCYCYYTAPQPGYFGKS